MRSQNTRSGGEGLERSCTGTAAGWLAGPEPVEMLGTSPHRYLLMRRLALARDLIHAARPLVDVACEAGFADQAHFTRVFRSAFGLTPARYRALRIRPRDLTGPRAVQ